MKLSRLQYAIDYFKQELQNKVSHMAWREKEMEAEKEKIRELVAIIEELETARKDGKITLL